MIHVHTNMHTPERDQTGTGQQTSKGYHYYTVEMISVYLLISLPDELKMEDVGQQGTHDYS